MTDEIYCTICGVYLKTKIEKERGICDDCYEHEDPEEVDFDDTAECIITNDDILPNFWLE